ncbi:MAG: thiamine phosphate synthase [Deltaproteobacteria bacterium]
MFELLLITGGPHTAQPLAIGAALASLPPGTTAVQLREKELGGRELAELARALLPICAARFAPLVVNDRVDVALALGLRGVHLGSSSLSPADARRLLGPHALVGVSCHSEAELLEAKGFASYATFGPIFETPSKRALGAPLGVEALSAASRLGVPLIALGGITPETIGRLEGAAGIAAIGAGLGAPDPARACAALWAAWLRRRPQRESSSGR